ncbi:hypothetical protein [Isobaculum melis]|uniref:Lipoprotein n=1 Tax=Isobaculum melis TaxID=142588 RepID=A0A1H9S0B6_9LACT|nr:hypothetical protein [Isobaculum melis]SER78384.1 hypothetical protein SAMN04488559_1067 [Isobaculum melis]
MKKIMTLMSLTVLFLTGCIDTSNKKSDEERESRIETVKIDSNMPKIKETKTINVFKLYERGNGAYTDADKKMIDHTFSTFNHTEQMVYEESLTFLIDKDYSKAISLEPEYASSGIVCVVGLLYNDTSNQIKSIKYEANLKLIINGDEVVLKNAFELDSPYYSYINPNEAINIFMEFEAGDYTETLSSISDIVDENTEVNLNNIEFYYKK